MCIEYRIYGVFNWLRKFDLNKRPSGYEFDSTFTKELIKTTIKTTFLNSFKEKKQVNRYKIPTFKLFICHTVKNLTNKNCTNYCTKNCTVNFIIKNRINLLYINTIHDFTTYFTTINYKVVNLKNLFYGLFLYFSRLHDLFFYILLFIFFIFFNLFFLNLIEKFSCEVVKNSFKFDFIDFKISRLSFLSREISCEVVK